MAVDKNLFLHDLAVVSTLKDEGHYLKEWLDYHLLAGVEHFYLYDHESVDNYNKIIKPYVDAGLVTSTRYSDAVSLYAVYNDAVRQFKFFNRYLTLIDGDEFIYPKSNRSIVEVVDEILSRDQNAAGLAINWQLYGSNGHDKADYSRGVLERFTRRAPTDFYFSENHKGVFSDVGNAYVKNIINPRKINFLYDPHTMNYFEPFYSVNENLNPIIGSHSFPISADKIVINHYHTKSREEYLIRKNRKEANNLEKRDIEKGFELHDRNEVFDDGILKYRANRAENFSLEDENQRLNRMFAALNKNLSAFASGVEVADKLETALTCRAVATFLRNQFPDDDRLKICEEASLAVIVNSIEGINFFEARLLIRELPDLLSLPYPVVDEVRIACLKLISRMKYTVSTMHRNMVYLWKDYVELDYLQRLLKNFRAT